jgi:hypothetical protein
MKMLCRIHDGVIFDDEGLPENRATTSSCFEGKPAIGFTILGGLGKDANLVTTLFSAKFESLTVSTFESTQLGYGKLATSILEKLTKLSTLSAPVGPNCQASLDFRVLIQES